MNLRLIERDRAYGARRLAEAEEDFRESGPLDEEELVSRIRGLRWLALVLAIAAMGSFAGLLWLCKASQP